MSVHNFENTPALQQLPSEHVVFTDLDGLEGILVDLNTKKYYQLNETASLIWRGLEKRLAISEIARQLTERYDVTLEEAMTSVGKVLRQFGSQKLVQPSNTTDSSR